MNLQTGHLIKVQARTIPVVNHYGFIIIDDNGNCCVLHNNTRLKNECNGTVIIEPYDRFIQGRKLVKCYNTGLSESQLMNLYDQNKTKVFDLFAFNCEHFVSSAFDKKQSPQILLFSFLLTLTFFYIYTKNN